MSTSKLVYIINDKEVERKDFYRILKRYVTNYSHCCIYEAEAEQKELKRIKRELLYGLTVKIAGVIFKIKRI
jgi:hypothetical protein